MLVLVLVMVPATLLAPAAGLAQSNPSGLPLPRFASTRSEPINVRVGPGTRYDVAWVFVRAGQPVEIIQEFDTWRKIRDVEGEEGWVHQNLLVGDRVGYVAPWDSESRIALRDGVAEESGVRAWLSSQLLVQIDECDGAVCGISVRAPDGGRTYSGYVTQSELWGVYSNEVFD